VNRHPRRRIEILGRVAAVAAPSFNADDLTLAAEPLERKGYAVAVVSNTEGMLAGRSAAGQDVHFVPASTVADMEVERYLGLILPGGSADIGESAKAAVAMFLKAGKPVLALSDGVDLLAEAAGAPDIVGAEAAIFARGQAFGARGETAAADASEVFADAVTSAADAVAA